MRQGTEEYGTMEQAGKIAGCTLLSRLLGLVRDVVIIAALGVGADIFFMAFRLPNIMRRMTAEGVLGMVHSANLGRRFPVLQNCAPQDSTGDRPENPTPGKEMDEQRQQNQQRHQGQQAQQEYQEAQESQEVQREVEQGRREGQGTYEERQEKGSPDSLPGGSQKGWSLAGFSLGGQTSPKNPLSSCPAAERIKRAGEAAPKPWGTASRQIADESPDYGPVISYSMRMAWKYGMIAALVAVFLGIFAPHCMRLVAPGFDGLRLESTIFLFRWCLLYLPLAAGTAILAATLISCRRAGHAALAPLFLNIGIILLGLGAFMTGSPAFFAAGVVVGGALQLGWLVWVVWRFGRMAEQSTPNGNQSPQVQSVHDQVAHAQPVHGQPVHGQPVHEQGVSGQATQARCGLAQSAQVWATPQEPAGARTISPENKGFGGLREIVREVRELFFAPRKTLDCLRDRMKTAGRICLAVLVGSSGYLYFFISAVGASFFAEGSVSAMYIAERLVEFPLALVGASFAMAFMPRFSVLIHERAALCQALEKNLRLCCFVIFPAAAGIVTLHVPIVRLLFGHGAMRGDEVLLAARVFAIMGLALPALCLSRQLMGVLIALDGARPFVVSQGAIMRRMGHTVWGGCLGILATSALLGPLLGLAAVAFGVVLASWGQCLFFWRMIRRELGMAGMGRRIGQERWPMAVFGALVLGLGIFGWWLGGLENEWISAVLLCCGIVAVAVGWIGGWALVGKTEARTLCSLLRGLAGGLRRGTVEGSGR